MNSFGFRRDYWNLNTISDFSDLKPNVITHLKNVYMTLALILGVSAFGAYFQIITKFSQLLSLILTFVSLFGLIFSYGKSETTRLLLLSAFAFFEGCSLGTLIDLAIQVDPKILVMALVSTTTIFLCFSLIAILSERRSYLFLGGLISSGMSILFLMAFFNIFFRTEATVMFTLILGLFIFMGYVIFDTQIIIEKADLGDRDYVMHALELFIDFVAIFVRILIILLKNKKKENK